MKQTFALNFYDILFFSDYQANLFIVNDDGKTALSLAVSAGHWEIVKKFVDHRRYRWKNVNFQDLVWEAVSGQHYVIACRLLAMQPSFQFKDPNIPIFLERCKTLSSDIAALSESHSSLERKKRDLEIYQNHLTTMLKSAKAELGAEIMPGNNEAKQFNPLEDLLCLLECPICMEEMFNVNILSCNNDHWVCQDCLAESQVAECPTCRQDFNAIAPLKKYSVEKVAAVAKRLKIQAEKQAKNK